MIRGPRSENCPFGGRGVSALFEVGAEVHEFESTLVGQTRRWELAVKNLHGRSVQIESVASDRRQFQVVGDRPFRTVGPGCPCDIQEGCQGCGFLKRASLGLRFRRRFIIVS